MAPWRQRRAHLLSLRFVGLGIMCMRQCVRSLCSGGRRRFVCNTQKRGLKGSIAGLQVGAGACLRATAALWRLRPPQPRRGWLAFRPPWLRNSRLLLLLLRQAASHAAPAAMARRASASGGCLSLLMLRHRAANGLLEQRHAAQGQD